MAAPLMIAITATLATAALVALPWIDLLNR